MTLAPGTPWPVRVRGRLGGEALDAGAELVLGPAHLLLRHSGGEVALPWSALDGAVEDGPVLVLAGRDGSALRCEGLPDARSVAAMVRDLGTDVPELTRGLRGFASVKGAPGSDHDLFFGPLLAARRALHAATSADARLAAVDPAQLEAALAEAAQTLAARRWPGEREAGDRRALAAELEDLLAPVRSALVRLAAAADGVRSAPPAGALRAWRMWCDQLIGVWSAADDAWLAALPALADSRGASGALWRRVLGRKGPA